MRNGKEIAVRNRFVAGDTQSVFVILQVPKVVVGFAVTQQQQQLAVRFGNL